MQDWLTYRLSDFLLFSPRTYYRMIERHNEAVWPAHLLTLALGIGILGALRRPTEVRGRIIAGVLALLWIWVAWAFLFRRYATINWAVSYLVPLFVVEALLLVWWGVIRRKLSFAVSDGPSAKWGTALLVLSLLLYPALAPLLGRPWQQAEVFGIVPDPTAVATVGVLLLTKSRVRWGLLPIPLLWCATAAATLWAMSAQS